MESEKPKPTDVFPRYRSGDRVSDPRTLGRRGTVTQSVLQNDNETWLYSIRWSDSPVPVDLRLDSDLAPENVISQMIGYRINGLIDDLRSQQTRWPPDSNSNLDELIEWIVDVRKYADAFVITSQELLWLQDLRNDIDGR